MSDDDDWFERALREDEEADDADVSESGPESESEKRSSDPGPNDARSREFESDDAGDSGAADGASEDSTAESDSSPAGFADADPYDGDDRHSSSGQTPSDAADERSEPSGPSASDGDGLFDEDFASAFEGAPGGGVGGGIGSGGSTPGSGEDSSGTFAEGSAGGFGDDGGSVDSFDDAGGGFGAGSDEGFGGGFGDSDDSFEDDFDDEEFESSIPRIDVGIEGLDSMVHGGVPERSLMTTIGSAGTGKTTFGLQFLHEALQQGENAVFITLEENHDRIVDTATEKGWAFDEYVEEGSLAVIDLDPIEMANSLTSIRNDLPRLVEEFGATRLVLDSVSLLEMMYDDQATRRNEVYDFTKSLKEAGVTTMLTSEASQDTPYASRHGIIEYLVDAVFVLRYIRGSDDFRETRLAVEIQKIRDANHSREIKPYAITDEGISVYRQANIF